MVFRYKLVYNVKVDAVDEEEAEEKIDLFFNSLYDEEDEDITIQEDSDYYSLGI